MNAFTFFTGDIPTQALLRDTSENTYGALALRHSDALWSGCIDAPGYMPAGSTRGVTLSDGECHTTSRYAPRAA